MSQKNKNLLAYLENIRNDFMMIQGYFKHECSKLRLVFKCKLGRIIKFRGVTCRIHNKLIKNVIQNCILRVLASEMKNGTVPWFIRNSAKIFN